MLGNNVKVHFAGSDGDDRFHHALTTAGVHYRLYSCYNYVRADNVEELPSGHILRVQDKQMNHVIQDSGLFTLMFGAQAGGAITKDGLTQWQDKLIEFVTKNRINATCVEIDCQKVLSVEGAWFFRERMRKKLPNRQINVFHIEDGKEGLKSLIDFADYIAISVPELRIYKPKTYKEDTKRLAHFIKSRKPDIDIHLLGCTQFEILKDLTFCTSADSTSWLSGVRYGFMNDGKQHKHVNKFDKQLFKERKAQIEREAGERVPAYIVNASLSATICRQKYERICGSQA